ncbi:Uri superfamily endonuclease [Altererythrobacter atlanticus]|nr:GIY-YIG nuclease family protein [Croceibacterium atlanticum]MBB5731183.1 Uri superfamily endonuclease [Croceibacterium atlanticum]
MISPARFAHLLQRQFPAAITTGPDGLDALQSAKGAYLLAIRLARPVIAFPGGADCMLAPGWYAYAGSANGPGGIKARLARHFRAEKKPHWHVDRLTLAAERMFALAFPGGKECAIIVALLGDTHFAVIAPGFGSSDCRQCPAHLLRFDAHPPRG